jgi:F-box interacting protein
MVGACNGLLCFLDVLRDAINIVEPFTGESITLPLPPESETWHEHGVYCFGFDLSSRRYKLLHLSRDKEQGVYVYKMYVYTIGEGTNWRSVSAAP